MDDFLFGAVGVPAKDSKRAREAGVEWTRLNIPMPFEDRMGGNLTRAYLEVRAEAEEIHRAGVKILGATMCPYRSRWLPDSNGIMRLNSTPVLPDWVGPVGSERYHQGYKDICYWLANDLKGTVGMWQIANELDIDLFAGPLTPRQCCDFILRGAEGVKEADPSLLVGHNPAGDPEGYFLYGWLYGQEPLLDYCGVDAYYGTWQRGGPENWAKRIIELSELTRVPVLVNEWGFSSGGGLIGENEVVPADGPPCQEGKWRHSWGHGHTPEGQAEFIRETFKVFRRHKDKLMGAFYFRWRDSEVCWQCGRKECPIETKWGLLDVSGESKPSLAAYSEGVALMKAAG